MLEEISLKECLQKIQILLLSKQIELYQIFKIPNKIP